MINNISINMSYAEDQDKHDVCLNLSINSQKSNIFVADLTPTPTRLIKNCEEIGLFDDLLRHDNPFEETFRRAIEQNYDETAAVRQSDRLEQPAEELHTPQVFPQLETSNSSYINCMTCHEENPISTSNCVTLDVPCLPCTDENFNQKEIDKTSTNDNLPIVNTSDTALSQQPATIIHLIQPQLITWKISNDVGDHFEKVKERKKHSNKIPIKSTKNYILPKPTPTNREQTNLKLPPSASTVTIASVSSTQHEPSSASLTPTSQLPIKERLKAILSNSSKTRSFEHTKTNNVASKNVPKITGNIDDTLERKRAASSRYRYKIRTEQHKLRHENNELKATNKKLLERIASMEREIEKQRSVIQQLQPMKDTAHIDNCLIRIPPSSLNLVINVPGMVVPTSNQAPQLQNSITYRIEKR